MSKGKRRRTRRTKKQARARRSRMEERTASATETAVMQAHERFTRYVRSASSFEDAAAAARADLRAAAEEVARLACGLDLITVVSSVRVGMIMNRAMTSAEPSAAVLELIALILACRDSSTSDAATAAAGSEFMPPEVETAAHQALDAGSLIVLFDTPPSDADSAIVFSSIQREISLRNPEDYLKLNLKK